MLLYFEVSVLNANHECIKFTWSAWRTVLSSFLSSSIVITSTSVMLTTIVFRLEAALYSWFTCIPLRSVHFVTINLWRSCLPAYSKDVSRWVVVACQTFNICGAFNIYHFLPVPSRCQSMFTNTKFVFPFLCVLKNETLRILLDILIGANYANILWECL